MIELLSSMRFAISLLTVICIASVIGTVLKQLQVYKSGKRPNAEMSGMVAGISDDDMRHIAFLAAS